MHISAAAEHARHLNKVHYHRYLKWLMEGLGAVAALVAVLLATQRLYPLHRFLPLAQIGGVHVGGYSSAEALTKLEAAGLEQARVKLSLNSATLNPTYADLGVSFDLNYTVIDALSQRQIDSYQDVLAVIKSADYQLKPRLNQQKFNAYINTAFAAYRQGPSNAQIIIENGQPAIRRELPGLRFTNTELMASVLDAASRGSKEVTLAVTELKPAIAVADLQPGLEQTRRLLGRQLTLTHQDQTFNLPSEILASWVGFKVAEDQKQVVPKLNLKKIQAYLKTVAAKINYAPKPAYRTLRNGRVIQQTAGTPGLSVDIATTATAVAAALNRGQTNLTLATNTLKPGVVDSYTYSPTSEGITLLIADFVASHGGTFGIYFQTLDGAITAQNQGSRSFVTASTFKMFLAYAVLKKVELGAMSLADKTDIGWTVDACIYEMIHHSTNFCAIALEKEIGWAEAQKLVAAAGFSHTNINNYDKNFNFVGDKVSTPADEALFFKKLNAGQLLGSKFTSKLLALFKGQVYRSGQPSGVPVTVANKVGFLEEGGYLHDVGITYAGRPYVLAIMTQWGNWGAFAELNRQIYNVLHQ